MKEKGKHIDEVFRERLSDLNVTPPADAWRVIESSVHRRKMRSFYIPRLVAASLLLFVLTGSLWLIFLRKPSDKGLADQPVFSTQPNKTATYPKQPASVTPQNNTAITTTQVVKPQPPEKAEKIPTYKPGFILPVEKTRENHGEAVAVTASSMPENLSLVFLSPKHNVVLFGEKEMTCSLEGKLLLTETQPALLPVSPVLKNQPVKKGTWGIGGDFGPVYAYRHLAESSPILSSYLNKSENGIISFAGNFSFFYKGTKHFSVQSGLGYYRLGQEVNDVIAFRMIKSGQLAVLESKGNDFIHVSEGELGYSGTPVFVANRKSPGGNDQVDFLLIRLGTGLYEPVDVQLKQELEFVEIPLLLRYSIIDRTLGLSVIGGMGTSFLVKGQTSLISDEGTTFLGDMYDLKKTNVNGTFGLGFSYKLSSSMQFRLEPTLKYYLNPVFKSPDISTHPYSIGIFSGMSFYF